MRVKYKTTFLLLKYVPILMFLLMLVRVLFILVLGVDLAFVSVIAGCAIFPSIVIFSISKIFNLCWIHKSMIMHLMFTDLIYNIGKHISFGILFVPIQTFILITGFVILFLLCTKTKLFTKYEKT